MTNHEHSNSSYVMGNHDCWFCRVEHAAYQAEYRRRVKEIYLEGQLVGHVVEVSK